MKITEKTFLVGLAAVGLYIGSFTAIKIAKPRVLTSNDGPGRAYCMIYLPLRFISASFARGYWANFSQQHWHSVRYMSFNAGNGYLDVEYLDGQQGRAWAGRDIDGAKEGEIWQIHFSHTLETWDDFSDHLIAGVDQTKKEPNKRTTAQRASRVADR